MVRHHDWGNDLARTDTGEDFLAEIARLSTEVSNCRALSPDDGRLSPKTVLNRFQLRSRLINLLDLAALCLLMGDRVQEDERAMLRNLHDEIRTTRDAFDNTKSKAAGDLAKKCYGLAYKVMVQGQSNAG